MGSESPWKEKSGLNLDLQGRGGWCDMQLHVVSDSKLKWHKMSCIVLKDKILVLLIYFRIQVVKLIYTFDCHSVAVLLHNITTLCYALHIVWYIILSNFGAMVTLWSIALLPCSSFFWQLEIFFTSCWKFISA